MKEKMVALKPGLYQAVMRMERRSIRLYMAEVREKLEKD